MKYNAGIIFFNPVERTKEFPRKKLKFERGTTKKPKFERDTKGCKRSTLSSFEIFISYAKFHDIKKFFLSSCCGNFVQTKRYSLRFVEKIFPVRKKLLSILFSQKIFLRMVPEFSTFYKKNSRHFLKVPATSTRVQRVDNIFRHGEVFEYFINVSS